MNKKMKLNDAVSFEKPNYCIISEEENDNLFDGAMITKNGETVEMCI